MNTLLQCAPTSGCCSTTNSHRQPSPVVWSLFDEPPLELSSVDAEDSELVAALELSDRLDELTCDGEESLNPGPLSLPDPPPPPPPSDPLLPCELSSADDPSADESASELPSPLEADSVALELSSSNSETDDESVSEPEMTDELPELSLVRLDVPVEVIPLAPDPLSDQSSLG